MLRVQHTQNRGDAAAGGRRHIPQTPERILDAPELLDDFYLNLLDWSSTNILSIALGDSIYLWDARDGKITQLVQTASDTHVTSLCFLPGGSQVAVGTSDHLVMVWDVEKLAQVRSMTGHSARVASLTPNGRLLSSGGRDSTIVHHDVRQQRWAAARPRPEVCGLRWSPSGTLASGGNDNILNVWDDRCAPPRLSAVGRAAPHASASRLRLPPLASRLSPQVHCAVVDGEHGDERDAALPLRRPPGGGEALAWCPWQKHLLASGGGTADRMIRFWNIRRARAPERRHQVAGVCAHVGEAREGARVVHGYSHNQVICGGTRRW